MILYTARVVDNADVTTLMGKLDDVLTGELDEEGTINHPYICIYIQYVRCCLLTKCNCNLLMFRKRNTEIDPKLENALLAAQYTAQYISAGNQLLNSKKSIIERGLATFCAEECLVDSELSRVKAKNKALLMELENYDSLELKYNNLIQFCVPKFDKFKRAEEKHRKSHSVRSHSTSYSDGICRRRQKSFESKSLVISIRNKLCYV